VDSIKFIASGSQFTYAISDAGTVYSWGLGMNYVLGHRSEETLFSPKELDPGLFDNEDVSDLD
jgi:alpha-tubulin suppressor-like RCC1 family protein